MPGSHKWVTEKQNSHREGQQTHWLVWDTADILLEGSMSLMENKSEVMRKSSSYDTMWY